MNKYDDNGLYFNALEKYPICMIVGDFGSGKSVTATAFAYMLQDKYENIFSNIKFKSPHIKYTHIEGDEIRLDNEKLHDGIIFVDELSASGGDAYQFLSQTSLEIYDFLNQIRKNNLAIFMINPKFKFSSKRIREVINFYIEIYRVNHIAGIVKMKIFKFENMRKKLIKTAMADFRPFFKMYNSRDIIHIKKKKKKVTKINRKKKKSDNINDYV